MASPTHNVIVTGAILRPKDSIDPTSPPPRLNIVDLIKKDIQWSLYIRALLHLQSLNGRHEDGSVEPMTWFGLASIHGSPRMPWDNAELRKHNDEEVNYCAHGVVTFPTWHRAYMAVFEQAIQQAAVEVASSLSSEWKEAALELRAPFWDWALQPVPPEEVFQDTELTIARDGGDPEVVRNPLYRYEFHDGENRNNELGQFPTTVRHFNSGLPPNQAFKETLMSLGRTLSGGGNSMRSVVYVSLILNRTWDQFSNTTTAGNNRVPLPANSLEMIHNAVHGAVGGRGHMSNPNVAAFDPIFWLHHANVDRLLAIWQVLHEDGWVSGPGLNTDLLPFWNGATTYYQSKDPSIQNWTGFHYTYPEFVGVPLNGDRRNIVLGRVANLYAPPRPDRSFDSLNASAAWDTAPATTRIAAVGTLGIQSASATQIATFAQKALFAPSAVAPPVVHHDGTHRQDNYYILITARRFNLDQTYTILAFLEEPGLPIDSDNASQWRTQANYVGQYTKFVNPSPAACKNCLAHMGDIDEGFIDINEQISRRLADNRHDRVAVHSFLQANLRWRIQLTDGTIKQFEKVERLRADIMVIATQWDDETVCWQPVPGETPTLLLSKLGNSPPEDE